VVAVDTKRKIIHLADNKKDQYDILINTSPLDLFIKSIKRADTKILKAVRGLKHNSVFIVGLGIKKAALINKSWIYFPDSRLPFFRVTYLSNYSDRNTPNSKKYYSLLCETSYSKFKKEDIKTLPERTIAGLISSGILQNSDRKNIVSKFMFDIKYAYPLPTLKRDESLKNILPALEEVSIYSRGRFGGWKYEIANMDHCVIQGKELIDRVILRTKESLWSLDN
jgi:protoporphyrinogen oxidase